MDGLKIENPDLMRRVVAAIERNPDSWDNALFFQRGYHACDTKACIAGWAIIVDGRYYDAESHMVVKPQLLPSDLISDLMKLWDKVLGHEALDARMLSGPKPWSRLLAMHLLGIDAKQADELFFDFQEDRNDKATPEERIARLKAKINEVTGMQFDEDNQ